MKKLFLDIDGVLNSHRTMMVWGSGFPKSGTNFKLDPVSVAILRKVVDAYNFEIILSSSWRIGFNRVACVHMWKEEMERQYNWANFPIVDITPDLGFNSAITRGDEIYHWLRDNTLVADALGTVPYDMDYIILDDESDMKMTQLDHFYRVDRHNGLGVDFFHWIENRYSNVG